MKTKILLMAFLMGAGSLFAQELDDKLDKSPMDATFYPAEAAKRAFRKGVTAPKVRVLYSRPALKGREIFKKEKEDKGITMYGQAWRLGANESTELLLMQDAMIGGKKIAAGRYTIVVTPHEDYWVFHINSENDGWGNYGHKPELDLVTVKVPVKNVENSLEHLTIALYSPNEDNVIHLKVGWGTYRTEMPITLM
ncbi:asparagine synthetase B [Nonlabens sp. MIC269]|uniref:DUF2911 domain-containing protein n=1 Tax=Nonlabens sp. MIC269 TaxID=1476901 RepID=UPI000721CD38|nr:DUF2911 domain-containing protein [Nonlabens sp. MIC269]ALM20698.1 asparagine synthetase B [Nonlabens sp. MIC269]